MGRGRLTVDGLRQGQGCYRRCHCGRAELRLVDLVWPNVQARTGFCDDFRRHLVEGPFDERVGDEAAAGVRGGGWGGRGGGRIAGDEDRGGAGGTS